MVQFIEAMTKCNSILLWNPRWVKDAMGHWVGYTKHVVCRNEAMCQDENVITQYDSGLQARHIVARESAQPPDEGVRRQLTGRRWDTVVVMGGRKRHGASAKQKSARAERLKLDCMRRDRDTIRRARASEREIRR